MRAARYGLISESMWMSLVIGTLLAKPHATSMSSLPIFIMVQGRDADRWGILLDKLH